jgi:hypothetical protein
MIMLDRAGGVSGVSTPEEEPPSPAEQESSSESVVDVNESPTEEVNPSEEEIKVENIPF